MSSQLRNANEFVKLIYFHNHISGVSRKNKLGEANYVLNWATPAVILAQRCGYYSLNRNQIPFLQVNEKHISQYFYPVNDSRETLSFHASTASPQNISVHSTCLVQVLLMLSTFYYSHCLGCHLSPDISLFPISRYSTLFMIFFVPY